MKKIRIGNDIPIKWAINRDGQPEDFTGKTIKLLLRTMQDEVEITDYAIEGNVISWTFFGKDQTKATAYTFTLIENEGKEGMFTIDACRVLQLVECSDQADDDDSNMNVEESTDGTSGEVTADSEIQIPAASESTDIDLSDYVTKTEFNQVKPSEWNFSTMKENAVERASFLNNAKLGDIVKNVEVLYNSGSGSSFKQLTTDIVLISKNPNNTTKSANWNSILYDASQYIQPISIVLAVSNESIAAAGTVLQIGNELESETVVIEGEHILKAGGEAQDYSLNYDTAQKIFEAIKANKRIVIHEGNIYATVVCSDVQDDTSSIIGYFVENTFFYMDIELVSDGQVSLLPRTYKLPFQ